MIVDRKKELIKYKGFQVPPAELEALLIQHPDLSDAGVVGVFSNVQQTELPRAYIVPRDPAKLDDPAFAQSVQAWVKERVVDGDLPAKRIHSGCECLYLQFRVVLERAQLVGRLLDYAGIVVVWSVGLAMEGDVRDRARRSDRVIGEVHL